MWVKVKTIVSVDVVLYQIHYLLYLSISNECLPKIRHGKQEYTTV